MYRLCVRCRTFGNTGVFVSKLEDIEKVANYLSSGDVDFKDGVRYTKAVTEFHNKLRPILKKID